MYHKCLLLNEFRKDEINRTKSMYQLSDNKKCLHYINLISNDIQNTEKQIKGFRERVDSISDSFMRKIVEMKVLDGCTFEYIANELHYSQRYIQKKYSESGFTGL